MLHIIFTALMVIVAVATLWFAIYVIVRLFKTDAPVTATPSGSAIANDDSSS
ncbi:MAG: hypothetical protein WAS05_07010 [Candidatus Nanopelagicales bacterium]